MKIGGRIIQDKKITVNDDCSFKAIYKNHLITVDLIKRGHTNDYAVYVRKLKVLSIPDKLDERTKRRTIREAIIYTLDRVGL